MADKPRECWLQTHRFGLSFLCGGWFGSAWRPPPLGPMCGDLWLAPTGCSRPSSEGPAPASPGSLSPGYPPTGRIQGVPTSVRRGVTGAVRLFPWVDQPLLLPLPCPPTAVAQAGWLGVWLEEAVPLPSWEQGLCPWGRVQVRQQGWLQSASLPEELRVPAEGSGQLPDHPPQWSLVWGPEVGHSEYLLKGALGRNPRVCAGRLGRGCGRSCIHGDKWNPGTEGENPQLFSAGATIGLGIWGLVSCFGDPAVGARPGGRGCSTL